MLLYSSFAATAHITLTLHDFLYVGGLGEATDHEHERHVATTWLLLQDVHDVLQDLVRRLLEQTWPQKTVGCF